MELTWRKSSYSAAHGECVETARLPHRAAATVRDSKNPAPTLTFPAAPWRAFLTALG